MNKERKKERKIHAPNPDSDNMQTGKPSSLYDNYWQPDSRGQAFVLLRPVCLFHLVQTPMSSHTLLIQFDGGVSNVIAAGRQAAGRADCDGGETALVS